MKKLLSLMLCILLIFQFSYCAGAENELPAPDRITTEQTEQNGINGVLLTVCPPENLPFEIEYFFIRCSNNMNIILDDKNGGTVFLTQSTTVQIQYTANGEKSPVFRTEITVGNVKTFEDAVTGVKADIEEGAKISETFSISSSVISDGNLFKNVKKQLGTFGKFLIFSINTVQNGEIYDTQTQIKWYLPVPDMFVPEYLYLYRTENDGTLTETDFTYKDGYAVFNADKAGIFTLYFDEKEHTGDVNIDGKITVTDARLILRQIAKLENLTGSALKNADINLDGRITVSDAKLLLRYIAGIELLDYIENNHAQEKEI